MATLAFVGCAHIHTPGFIKAIQKRGEEIKIKSVWDHDADRARKRADELKAQVVAKPEVIFADGDVAGVIICSETNRHGQLVPPAAAAKKHIFAEKPLGISAKDAYAMADAIDKAGVKFQTGYFQRGLPVHQFIKQSIDAGHFGKITRAR